jgi:hypothetical protein
MAIPSVKGGGEGKREAIFNGRNTGNGVDSGMP